MARPVTHDNLITDLCKKHNLTQQGFADMTGIHYTTVFKMVQGGRNGRSITMTSAIKIATAFGLSVEEVYEGGIPSFKHMVEVEAIVYPKQDGGFEVYHSSKTLKDVAITVAINDDSKNTIGDYIEALKVPK